MTDHSQDIAESISRREALKATYPELFHELTDIYSGPVKLDS